MMPLIGNFNDLLDQWRNLASETLSKLFELSKIDESVLLGKAIPHPAQPRSIRSNVYNVDFPQPDGPTNTQNSPCSISRSVPLIHSADPYDVRTPFKPIFAIRWPPLHYLPPVKAIPIIMFFCRNKNECYMQKCQGRHRQQVIPFNK